MGLRERVLGRPGGERPWRQAIKHAMERAVPTRLMLTQMPRGQGRVYFTFDDGPDPEHTPVLLEALEAVSARGTFFVIGEKAAAHPELVGRLVRHGHAVGGHSYHHHEPGKVRAATLADEARRTLEVLAAAGAPRSLLFRPPYGAVTAEKLGRLWLDRQQIALWNVDPKDYAMHSAAELADYFAAHPPEDGDIVLLHDVAPFAAQVLPEVIRQMARRGLTACALPMPV